MPLTEVPAEIRTTPPVRPLTAPAPPEAIGSPAPVIRAALTLTPPPAPRPPPRAEPAIDPSPTSPRAAPDAAPRPPIAIQPLILAGPPPARPEPRRTPTEPRAAAADDRPVVSVSIGRVVVRLAEPLAPEPERPEPARPGPSLQEYLDRRRAAR